MRTYDLLYFLFARASWRGKGSKGQDSSNGSVLELSCRSSNTHLIESPFGVIKSGFKEGYHKWVYHIKQFVL